MCNSSLCRTEASTLKARQNELMSRSTTAPCEETAEKVSSSILCHLQTRHLQANLKVGLHPHLQNGLKQLVCIFYGERRAGIIDR